MQFFSSLYYKYYTQYEKTKKVSLKISSKCNMEKIISYFFSVLNLKLPEAVLKEVAQAEKVRIDLLLLKNQIKTNHP